MNYWLSFNNAAARLDEKHEELMKLERLEKKSRSVRQRIETLKIEVRMLWGRVERLRSVLFPGQED